VGTTALVARAVGAQDANLARRAVHQSILLGTLVGVLSMVLGLALAGPAILVVGAGPDTAPLAAHYLEIVATTFLLSTLMFVANAALRGAGDTRTPMVIMLVVNGINALVAWALINGVAGLPALGLTGSAVGQAVGRAIGGVLALVALLRNRGVLRLRAGGLRPDLRLMGRILRVGLPSGIENVLFRLGQMAFFTVVAGLGTAALAAQQIVLNASSVAWLPGFGFAVAATTLVGQSLGAQDPRRAARSGIIAFWWGLALMVVMGVILAAFPALFTTFFTNDAEVIALGVRPLQVLALSQPFLAAAMILGGALRGAGDTNTPLWVNAGSLWLVRVPLAAYLAQGLATIVPAWLPVTLPAWLAAGPGWGLTGAWVGAGVDLFVRGGLLWLFFRAGRWKKAQV
jgi:putative MATE family efflux protein